MKNILVVDNDPITLHSFVGLLKSQSNFLHIIPAESIQEAIEILDKGKIHLLITGMHISETDIFKLSLLLSNNSETRVIILTNNSSASFRAKIRKMRSVVHFDQVLDMSMLTKRIFMELQINYGGQVQGLALASILQLLELEKRTCTLLVASKASTGMLYLIDGKPTAARMGQLTGKPAALHILSWQNVLIDIDYKPREVSQEITASLMNLLLESGQFVDETLSQRLNLRKDTRYDCLVGVDFQIGDVTYQCYMHDLSEGGAYLETEQSIDLKQKIVMTLYSPMLERSCTIHATVTRRDTKGLGVKFEALIPEQKHIIHSLIESCCTPISDRSEQK